MSADIDVRDLVVRYRGRRALNGLSLYFSSGVNGLLGPNGAGKTTLMRVLATVAGWNSGEVRLMGRELSTRESELRELRRQIGYLPQHFGYYPRYTVRDFVEYFAWLKEVPRTEVTLAVDRALERVELTERADSKLKHLSGGMLRRVGIAQAIVNQPAILLLDEPTVGLDPEQRVQFRELLRQLGLDSCVLVSTHLIEDVANACHSVSIMDNGRKVFAGPPDELATLGSADSTGDSDIERGYTAALHSARSNAA